MQFGLCVATKIDDWQLIKYAEELGYHRAWVPDSQMIWSDCYATLALAAHNTSRIHIGETYVKDDLLVRGRSRRCDLVNARVCSARVSSNGEIDVRHAMRQGLPRCVF